MYLKEDLCLEVEMKEELKHRMFHKALPWAPINTVRLHSYGILYKNGMGTVQAAWTHITAQLKEEADAIPG